ncbi:MAG: hypothetical protein HYS27_11775 [Deltaproteobacteria bacterium]|nr:hypothetical protein [Deltaproteobacteria bacterium]
MTNRSSARWSLPKATALVCTVLLCAPALASGDLATLLNRPEAEARAVLESIAVAPSVTGGIHELTPLSDSRLCTFRQLSTVEADVYLHDGLVTRVEDRRRPTPLGDQQAAFAFLRSIEQQTGSTARISPDGQYARFATGPDVAMVFRIVPRGSVFTVVATGAEIVNADAKCDARKAAEAKAQAAEAKAQREAETSEQRGRCEGGEVRACAKAASMADDSALALALARRGCAGGDADGCSELVRVAARKGAVTQPQDCADVFDARAKSCREAPTRDLCDIRLLVRGCLDYQETGAQARDRQFGACVAHGQTRAACEAEERDKATAVAASRGDEIRPGMPVAAFLATGVGAALPKKPYSAKKNACGSMAAYRSASGLVQYTMVDGKLAEVRRYREVEVGAHSKKDTDNKRTLAAHVAKVCGKAKVRELWPDSDDGAVELVCDVAKDLGHGAAVVVHDDDGHPKLVQVADFDFEPKLAARLARCFPPDPGDNEYPD